MKDVEEKEDKDRRSEALYTPISSS